MVTAKPVSPAHLNCSASSAVSGTRFPNDSTMDRSSKFHVFPTEKVPFGFSLALCIRTRPVLLTAKRMTLSFLFSGGEFGGGGVVGNRESSVMRMWVMYRSDTAAR